MKSQPEIIEKTVEFVKARLKLDASGHDWWHIYRVHKLAKHLAKQEGAKPFVVELAALLHDISDWKMNGGDETKGGKIAKEWLQSLGVAPHICDEVDKIICTASFKGAKVIDNIQTLEGKIVQDADRLDAMGAIGIARTFAYGGHKNRQMHNPEIAPLFHDSFESYKKNDSSTINHFHEKLLLLKDRMNTKTARLLAKKRHAFMGLFLETFFEEWNLHEEITSEDTKIR